MAKQVNGFILHISYENTTQSALQITQAEQKKETIKTVKASLQSSCRWIYELSISGLELQFQLQM